MLDIKNEILEKIGFTDLVYGRINKKLNQNLTIDEIEKLIMEVIKGTDESGFQRIGKNIYISNQFKNIKLTINATTTNIITADLLIKKYIVNI